MKTTARVTSHPDICNAIETLRRALTTHCHVRDFAFHVEIQGHVIGEWNGLNREIVPVPHDEPEDRDPNLAEELGVAL